MVVIDWLQTCEFVREHYEPFILYCLCGYLIGISIILMSIIIILYAKKYLKKNKTYQSPRTDFQYDDIPVYRYDGRTQHEFYHM